ncbi:MAG: DUF1573 domain-containing protein [Spirochaetales bacterium]|nr:DUF1573 domain-containing protein [Spirochaetales bacterium]
MDKKMLFWIFIIVCFLFTLSSCNGEKGPAIKFSNHIYKFGEINEGDKVEYTFSFINSGTDTLLIKNVRGTCGCTVPGNYTREIAPGKSGEIPVVFNSFGFQGNVIKTIKVETNIPDTEPFSLTLEGNINVIVELSTRTIWLGQTRKDGPPLKGSIILNNHTETPMKIIKAEVSGKQCVVKVIPIVEGKEYEVELTVSPPFKEDQVREILTITTNIKGKEVIDVQYHYYGIADIEVGPKEIIVYLKNMQPDSMRIITIQSHIDELFELTNPLVHGKNMDLTVETLVPGKHMQLLIKFKEGFTFPENESMAVSFGVKNKQGETQYTIPIINGDTL